MTLSFITKWPKHMGPLAGKPNYFIEKIWENLIDNNNDGYSYVEYNQKHLDQFGYYWDEPMINSIAIVNQKLHTIRQGNRWKAGMKIHPVINNRSKNRFQFAPIINCVSVQEIELNWNRLSEHCKIDGKYITVEKLEELALNDGFDSLEDFYSYFNQDFKGQIIHWTDFKY